MKPVIFPQCNSVFAEEQTEYLNLPAYRETDKQGLVITCWKMTWGERWRALFGGCIWLRMLTFNQPLQPVSLEVVPPFFGDDEEATPDS